jgi:hypothetical protein
MLQAKNIVFDTEDVLIDGAGKIDLEKEEFDLSIRGHPKKLRLLRLKSPIVIRGSLRKPDRIAGGTNRIRATAATRT